MEKTDLKTQLAEVAERIRTMREITGLSEDEMAKCTGVTKEEYQKCEAGEADFSFTFIWTLPEISAAAKCPAGTGETVSPLCGDHPGRKRDFKRHDLQK
ncbi:MAG: helix-turn-helix domain-containing protein [Eubacteriales bacterium]